MERDNVARGKAREGALLRLGHRANRVSSMRAAREAVGTNPGRWRKGVQSESRLLDHDQT
jgi:hypothetical protein